MDSWLNFNLDNMEKNKKYIEPTEKQIKNKMELENKSYYNAREELRKLYNGKVPHGHQSWGDYWKSY